MHVEGLISGADLDIGVQKIGVVTLKSGVEGFGEVDGIAGLETFLYEFTRDEVIERKAAYKFDNLAGG